MTSVLRICRKCGAEIFADAPEELCTACVLETGLALLPEALDGEGEGNFAPAPHTKIAAHAAKMLGDLGDYELLEEIGRGGQGVVFRARQKSLNRTVALKIIGLGQWATNAHLKRFRLEAEAAASLNHPCIVPIYEVGEREGTCYFSMGFIEGDQLDEIAKSEAMPVQCAAELIAKVARTVHYAHEHHILHRDIKPGNILLDQKGEPHLTDSRWKFWARPATWPRNKRWEITRGSPARQMFTDSAQCFTNCSPAIRLLLGEQPLKRSGWFWTLSRGSRAS
ncbi:MAG: hypothetical protein DMC62_07350 [Verrucomicrobia bacterium]|nr:MAG: hypothetical protein DMC62_07350 [Verrucomicrobiota bacterium]